eukprot:1158842-Pelagomonas_calceolata.AAC.6
MGVSRQGLLSFIQCQKDGDVKIQKHQQRRAPALPQLSNIPKVGWLPIPMDIAPPLNSACVASNCSTSCESDAAAHGLKQQQQLVLCSCYAF